jgi:SAM-dependent methyltransferase
MMNNSALRVEEGTFANLTQPADETLFYSCIRCHNDFAESETDGLHCGVCGAFYPSIEDVKIFVANPDQLLQKQIEWLPEKRTELSAWMQRMESIYDKDLHAPESLELLKKSYQGAIANLDVIDQQLAPVRNYLEGRTQPHSLFSDFAGGGWPSLELLDYFYRDWNGTEEAEVIENIFIEGIERFCDDWNSVAVLGSGAGGVVYLAANYFQQTFGVELSIDTLLLSKVLLAGGDFTLNYSLPRPNFPLATKTVRIEGAPQPRENISLMSADVHQLPFRSGSLSCVITNYVMDVIPNQKKVAAEIYRVLAKDGVWLDLSLPISMSAADQFNTLDMPRYLEQAGFKLLQRRRHRYNFLDLSPISEWSWFHNQTPVMSVARKVSGSVQAQPNYFAEYFAETSDAIWQRVPKRVVDVSLIQERQFTGEEINESKALVVQPLNNHRPAKFKVSNETAMLTEWLLQTIDGTRTLREIFDLMRQTFGELVQPDDMVKFFYDLEVSSLIEIR